MQDIHSIGGGAGRFFGGSGGDRRLRQHHQNHLSLKCPRCDSPNTKFCYYNNYNLSQPRHFCKSCRRYWTKGGVLRNVPVGGGCRKAKRSKHKASSDASRDSKTNSHSSSESSSLTASTTTATTASATAPAATASATLEVGSANSSTSASTLLNFSDSRFFSVPQNTNPSFDLPLIDEASGSGIFPEIGSFTSLMTSSNDLSVLGFNITDVSPTAYRLNQQNLQNQRSNQQWEQEQQQQQKIASSMPDDLKMQEITARFLDQTAQIDLSGLQNRESNGGGGGGGMGALDWQPGGDDQGLYDLPGAVDQAYWSTQTQWTVNDHHPMFLHQPYQ